MSNPSVSQHDKPSAPSTPSMPSRRGARVLTPAVDVFENQNGITLLADLPGVSRDALDIQVEAETLTIEGEIAAHLLQGSGASGTPQASQGTRSVYRRVFTLGKALDTEQVSADLKHGVLTLRIPKATHAKPRKVAVQVG